MAARLTIRGAGAAHTPLRRATLRRSCVLCDAATLQLFVDMSAAVVARQAAGVVFAAIVVRQTIAFSGDVVGLRDCCAFDIWLLADGGTRRCNPTHVVGVV